MRALILLIILAGLSWWYFDYSHRMTDAQVRELYTSQQEAIRQFDAERQCAQIDDDFHGRMLIRQGGQSSEQEFNKKQACDLITMSTNLSRRVADRTGGQYTPDVDIEIKSVALTPNRKQATVQTVTTVRMGGTTISRDRSTDTLVRSHGRVRVLASDSNTWAYAPQ